MVNVSDYLWVFIILGLLLIVCCCATWSRKFRNNANANQTAETGPPGTGQTNPNRVRILNVETTYTLPSPGIRPSDFSPPPLYLGSEPSPFTFENEIGSGHGLTNHGQDSIEPPPSYDDVIKADFRQTSRSRTRENVETEDTKL